MDQINPQTLDSLIIQSLDAQELEFFESIILKRIAGESQFSKCKLLYRGSRDGLVKQEFEPRCFNIPNTLILIKSQQNQIIGGFTPVMWKDFGGLYTADPWMKTFIYSITKKEIYPIKPDRARFALNSNPHTDNNIELQFTNDLLFQLPHRKKVEWYPPSIQSNFPESYDVSAYPHIPPLDYFNTGNMYLLNAPNNRYDDLARPKIMELEVVSFE